MADNNEDGGVNVDSFDFANEGASEETPMFVNYLITRLHQAMANRALQGEVQRQLQTYGFLPPHQKERVLEKSLGETSKRGISKLWASVAVLQWIELEMGLGLRLLEMAMCPWEMKVLKMNGLWEREEQAVILGEESRAAPNLHSSPLSSSGEEMMQAALPHTSKKISLDCRQNNGFIPSSFSSPKLCAKSPNFTCWEKHNLSSPIRAAQVSSPALRDSPSSRNSPTRHGGSSSTRGAAKGSNLRRLSATVTIRRKHNTNLLESFLERGLEGLLDKGFQDFDARLDSAGLKVTLQLISTDLDPKTKKAKVSQEAILKDWEKKAWYVADKVEYTADFMVPDDFGLPGAITILNGHPHEFYLETIALDSWNGDKLYFPCYSWVHSKIDSPEKRFFFSNQVYLPDETPDGLKDLREKEMSFMMGDGRGLRKRHERIYDYAVYNDLGHPDKHKDFARPQFGGTRERAYPRRVRTGRTSQKTDLKSEIVLGRGSEYYVPRDEAFEDLKKEAYVAGNIKLFVHELLPMVEKTLTKKSEFKCFSDIDHLYKESVKLQEQQQPDLWTNMVGLFANLNNYKQGLPRFLEKLEDSIGIRFSTPQLIAKDRFSWLRDEEMGRQALAGVNPLQIELVKSFPLTSNLDAEVYGPKESAIKAEHLDQHLGGLSVQEAIEQKRLFVIDYNDAFMPFLNQINALKDRKMYACRTIFFLHESGTLSPVAIELSLPPSSPGCLGSQRVFTPGQDATTHWLWQLAKAHASSNDAGYHQLVNHWLRSHAVVEPYVIATHRQLSVLHPISKLLLPHLRYTLEINALARQLLINAGGVIETCFTTGPYSMEVSSAAYKSLWRFDMENLPADLLRRGMAMEDPDRPGKLKLVIEDYPYAADGLLIWNAIQEWVNEYVSLYYSNPESIANDKEIHKWWEEIRQKGHGDKSNEPWWPELNTKEDLASILSSIIWVTSAHHAAVNFGQYAYGGYVPNHPCMTRRLIPEEDLKNKEFRELLQDPQKFFLSMISNKFQATYVMSVMDSLSTHAPDEEYLGQRVQVNWTSDLRAIAGSNAFGQKVKQIERVIDRRNADVGLKNRNGAGVVPYELLRPTSGAGVTGRGIPNSISI
ncbi:hypothetical protein L7F22_060821 [Adiantum nelumboides]|nr:hypothetical protein [Adiantum nelumboides]